MRFIAYDLAIDLFEKAKALRPDEPQSWRDLALALTQRGNLAVQKAYFTNVVLPETVSMAYSDWRRAMDIDWMTRDGLAQAIPPAYTEFLGYALMEHIREAAA